MHFPKLRLILAFLALSTFRLSAQVPHITKDINKTYVSGNPQGYCAAHGYLYFNGTGVGTGSELWRSDGSKAGTKLFADIVKGPYSSNPTNLTAVGSTLYFVATTASYGAELWKIDSGATVPVLVKDIRSGANGSGITNLASYNNKLYFSASADAAGDYELYTSDGTDTGTFMLKDINKGTASSQPSLFTISHNILYFIATTAAEGQELWRTDGTTAGTYLVKDVYSGLSGSYISSMASYRDTLYFNATTPGSPGTYLGLWKSDGSDSGTKKMPSATATDYSSVNYLTVCNGWLYFTGYNTTVGQELFRTKGTSVSLMKDIDPGNTGSSPMSLVVADTILYFTATGYNGRELHRCNGTTAGTGIIRDLYPIQTDAQISNLTAVGNTVYFSAQESPNYGDYELFKCKGTSLTKVKDIYVGTTSSQSSNYYSWKGKLYLTANDNVVGKEMWVSDGTSAGTTLLQDVYAGTLSSGIASMAEYKGGVIFNASEPNLLDELYRSSGDSSQTKLVKDIGTNSPYSSAPRKLTNLGGKVFFTTEPYSSYGDHFFTDGVSVNEITTNSSYYGQADNWMSFNGKVYYTWNQSGFYPDLYCYTSGNYGSRVMTLDKSKLGDKVANLTVFKDQLFFAASDGTSGTGVELYKSTKSHAVTLVKDIYSSYYSSNPSNLLVFDTSQMLFSAGNNTNGTELYTTDGTTAGTKILKDIVVGAGSSSPSNFKKFGNYMYFSATTAANGRELYRTDGTANGTELFLDINSGSGHSNPSKFVVVDTMMYFLADDGNSGVELWVTNGTVAGTFLVKDIVKGVNSSNILNMTAAGKWLYFTANDGVNGQELWRTNGLTTTMLPEVYEGSESSNPSLLTLHNDTLYFTADHPEFGNELWYIYTKCMLVKFKASQTCAGTPVEFTNLTDSFGRKMTNVTWDFGDTMIQNSGKNTQCVFQNPGKFKVNLIVTNEDGCTENWLDSVLVYEKPIAKFTTNNDTQCLATNAFSFTNVSSPTKVMKHEWNYGVGVLDTMKVGYKKYTAIGTYKVKLIERLGLYCSDSMIDTVVVMPKPVDINIVGKATTLTAQDTFTAVVAKAKSVYTWVITGGTKLSGGNSSEIVVKWNTPPLTATIKVTETDSFGCLGTQKSKSVTVQKPSSSVSFHSKNIQLYPNPASQKMQLILPKDFAQNANIFLYNNVGQLIDNISIQSIHTEIDCSKYHPGMYNARLEFNGNVYTEKIIIESR